MFGSKKGRRKLIEGFYHLNDLAEEHATEIPPNKHFAEDLYKILKAKGSSDICYIISTNQELDKKELNLLEVLEKIVGDSNGTFISCISGKLGYYEEESPGSRYIFEKK